MLKSSWLKKLKGQLSDAQLEGVKEIFGMTDSVFKVENGCCGEIHVYGEMGGDALHYVWSPKYGIGMK